MAKFETFYDEQHRLNRVSNHRLPSEAVVGGEFVGLIECGRSLRRGRLSKEK